MKTLTKMLTALHEDLPAKSKVETEFREWYLKIIKDTFKEWLKTVGLPDHINYGKGGVSFNATESTRKLLITSMDEP